MALLLAAASFLATVLSLLALFIAALSFMAIDPFRLWSIIAVLATLFLASITCTANALLRSPMPGRGLSAIALTLNLFQLTIGVALAILAYFRL